MPIDDDNPDRTARVGNEIYRRVVTLFLRPEDFGRVIAIDVRSEMWAIGDSAILAAGDLRKMKPEADVWLVRVGAKAYHRIQRRLWARQTSDRIMEVL